MRRVVVFALVALLLATASVSAAATNLYGNVTANDWSYKAVKDLIQAGIIAGDADRFAGKPIIRYEMGIYVANGMSNTANANAEQKAIIEKLGAEYSAELAALGAKPDKPQAAKQNPINFMFETRLQFDTTSLGKNDGGAWPANGNIKEKNSYYFRNRVYLAGAVNENWTYISRYYQAANNINSVDSTGRWDRWYVEGKNVLGGTLLLGKHFVAPGKGAFVNFYQDINGVTYKGKIGDFELKLGDYRYVINGMNAMGATGQDASYGELRYKAKGFDMSVYNFRHNWNDTTRDMDIRGVTAGVELGQGWGLIGEFVKNSASSPDYNKTGYIIALSSKYGPSWRVPHAYGYEDGPTAVSGNIVGDSLWAISYRHAPAGVAGKWNRGMMAAVPYATDTTGAYQNTFYDINAWRIDYYRTIAKNVTWVIAFDHVKPITGTWTNNSIQTVLVYTFK